MWSRRRFGTLRAAAPPEEVVMPRVGMVVLLGGAVGAARPPHGARARGIPAVPAPPSSAATTR